MPTVALTNARGEAVNVTSLPELNHRLRQGYRPSGTVAAAQQEFTGQPAEPAALEDAAALGLIRPSLVTTYHGTSGTARTLTVERLSIGYER